MHLLPIPLGNLFTRWSSRGFGSTISLLLFHFLLLLLLGCGEDPGRVAIRLSWGAAGAPSEPAATIFSRIVEGDLDPEGRLVVGPALVQKPSLAEAEPVRASATARLTFSEVPHGDRRVVIIEVREAAARTAPLLRYGISRPFSLVAGRVTTVDVVLDLVRPPAAEGGRGEVRVGTATTAEVFVRSPDVELRLTTDSGVRALVSNFESFPAGSAESVLTAIYDLRDPIHPGCSVEPGTDSPCTYLVPWNLNRGFVDDCGVDPAKGHARQDRCVRRVFVQLEDAAGQRSTLLSTDVVLDTKAPELLPEGTGILPADVQPDAAVILSLTFSEPVLPSSVEPVFEGSAVLLERISPAPGISTPAGSYRHRLFRAGDLGGAGPFEVVVGARDRAGNQMSDVRLDEQLRVDGILPRITGLEIRAPAPSAEGVAPRAAAGTSVEVAFVLENEAITADRLEVRLGDADMDCGPLPFAAGATLECASEPLRPPAVPVTLFTQVLVQARDAAGNRAEAAAPIVLDFEAPALASVAVEHVPGPDNLLAQVDAARSGSRVVIELGFEEAVQSPPPRFSARLTPPGGAERSLDFELAPASVGPQNATYIATIPPGFPSGDYADEGATCPSTPCGGFRPELELVDLVGNRGTLTRFPGAVIRIRVGAPALEVRQSQVSFIRSPVGNGIAEDLGAFEIPAGPYFALGPADGLANTATLAADTFQLAGGVRPTGIRVFADPEGQNPLSAVIRPEPDGGWHRSRLELSSPDVSVVFVSGIDAAGNESMPVRIESAWFIGTTRTPANGLTPHRMTTSRTPSAPLEPQLPIRERDLLDAPDGRAERSTAGYAWRHRPLSSSGPLFQNPIVYDSARDRVVTSPGATSEWDGSSWRIIRPPAESPQLSLGEALAYDSVRGRTVLFGATGETWEWDGEDWLNLTPTATTASPVPVSNAAMAFDAARGRVVLFGGVANFRVFGDTWEWDGETWTRRQPAGSSPPRRAHHAMAYDAGRGRVVLFGGVTVGGVFLSDTWEWDGSTWTEVTPQAGSPSARFGAGMTYDLERGRIVLVGGSEMTDTWTWDGTSWTQLVTSGRLPLASFVGLAYDARRRQVVWSADQETFVLEGSTWRDVTTSLSPTPSFRTGTLHLTYDERRARLVAFGLSVLYGWTETWEWDGHEWAEVGDFLGSPPARRDGAMAYDPSRREVVLFGGLDGAGRPLNDTWVFDGLFWSPRSSSGSPRARSHSRMVFDTARDALVLYGGLGATSPLADTWTWDGAAWTTPALPASPPPMWDLGLAYDERRREVLLFGQESSTSSASTWVLDGTGWREVAARGTGPSTRRGPAMAYDRQTGQVVLFGGFDTSSNFLLDTWLFGGAGWSDASATFEAAQRGIFDLFFDPVRGTVSAVGFSYGFHDLELPGVPSAQLAVRLPPEIRPADVRGLRVRMHCGGRYAPFGANDVGASLYGWVTGGLGRPTGSWSVLASNAAGVPLASSAAGLIDVQASGSDAAERTRSLFGPDNRMFFQCRPEGESGAGAAEVAFDYGEVRVRYATHQL